MVFPALHRLHIEDYGLIVRAEVAFDPAMTMFTGETGSGKTMLVGALEFVLGERADAEMVRAGASRARVTLTVAPDEALRQGARAEGIEIEDGEDLVVVREVSAGGRSQARVNGTSIAAAQLRALLGTLVDVVGQHEAQRLLAPAFALEILDGFAGAPARAARERVADAYERVQRYDAEVAGLDADAERARLRHDDARDALAQIASAALEPGEDERLRERRELLVNAERIAAGLQSAHDAVDRDDGGAIDVLGTAANALHAIARYGEGLRALAATADALQSELNDFAAAIARERDASDFDPAELDSIEERLATLERLQRRFGMPADALIGERERLAELLEEYATRDARRDALVAEREAARRQLVEAARELGTFRHAAASSLEERVAVELRELAMPAARFAFGFEELPAIGPGGTERVEVRFAPNPGEPLRALARSASGGELSRVLLALVVALAERRDRSALVFDEIDAGIGGATALALATRLGRLARDGQVICVTHLAQIAAWADTHVVLHKRDDPDGTQIELQTLEDRGERLGEIARMLSGDVRRVSVEHAAALVRDAEERKGTSPAGR